MQEKKETWTITVKVKMVSSTITRDLYVFRKYEDYKMFEYKYKAFFRAKRMYEKDIQEHVSNQEFCHEFMDNYENDSFPWVDNFTELDLDVIRDFILDVYGVIVDVGYDFFDFKTIHEVQTIEREIIKMTELFNH